MRNLLLISSILCLSISTIAHNKLSYFIEIDNADDKTINDSVFYSISRTIEFPVNKYNIPQDSEIRAELAKQIKAMDSLGYHFDGGIVRGAASPEGKLGWNKVLSHRRRMAILDLIGQNEPHIDSTKFSIWEIPEDYQYLLYMMREANDPDYDRVREIVDRYKETDILKLKTELRKLDDFRLWNRLLKEYYPSLRSARVVFFVSRDEPEVIEVQDSCVAEVEEPIAIVEPMVLEEVSDIEIEEEECKPIPRREVLSVSTNLLYDFAYMPGYDRFCPIPNISIEYYPMHGHFTFGASFACPWWSHYEQHKFFQVRNYQLESRYYLRSGDVLSNAPGQGAAYRGLYAKAYTNLGLYSICFDTKRGWEGEALGAGLGIGYVLPISKNGHWRLDFGVQFGYLWTKYDPYQWECPVNPDEHDHKYYYQTTLGPSLFKKRQHQLDWFGPTGISISITYDLLYRRQNKKGASFRNIEKCVEQ